MQLNILSRHLVRLAESSHPPCAIRKDNIGMMLLGLELGGYLACLLNKFMILIISHLCILFHHVHKFSNKIFVTFFSDTFRRRMRMKHAHQKIHILKGVGYPFQFKDNRQGVILTCPRFSRWKSSRRLLRHFRANEDSSTTRRLKGSFLHREKINKIVSSQNIWKWYCNLNAGPGGM